MKKDKRLLILGAGRGQVGLYKAAEEMGVHTIAGTMPGNNLPCIKYTKEVCEMDISNPDEVLQKAKTLKIDGIATCCLDTGVPALGRVCDELHLTGLTGASAAMCGDKLKMKKAFMKEGVSTAKFLKVSSKKELGEALDSLQMPVIIKATDLQGSNGIYISKTREMAIDGFNEAMKKTKKSHVIVEEFIEGWEFGAQAFVHNGKVLFVMPHGDETFMSHTAVPVGHFVPLDAPQKIINQTKEEVEKAIKAIGLNNCAVNVDLILKDNKVYIIELTGRVGANCLPELVQINYGIEYYKMIAAMAVGENPLTFWENRRKTTKAGLAKMILETEKTGKLESIDYKGELNDNILEVTFFKNKGDIIRKFENSNDCIGQIIVQGDTKSECDQIIEDVLDKITINLQGQ